MVVGMEGVWGFLLTALVALPIASIIPGEEGQGLHEDFIGSLIMWYGRRQRASVARTA